MPGKILVNETCLSLLGKTKNLRYTMALKMRLLSRPDTNISMNTYLEMIQTFLLHDMQNAVVSPFMLEDFTLLSFVKCSDRVNKFSEVYVYIRIFFDSIVHRESFEKSLLEFTNLTTTWTFPYMNVWKVKLQTNQFALFLPSLLSKLNTDKNCWVFSDKLYHGNPVFRNVIVDPLLTCPQILVSNNAFGIAWETIKLNFSFKEFTLTLNLFHSFDSKGFRICVRDLPHYIEHYRLGQTEKQPGLILAIVTTICIVISMVCLVLTFITYASFKSLQTAPGLNNMCLIATLFSAQFLLLLRQFLAFKDYEVGTIILAICAHFLWLSTFLWLQVCSFHMFLVFTSKVGLDSRNTVARHVFVRYAGYALGTPVCIVVLNLAVSLIVSKGKETGYDMTSTLFTYKTALIVTFLIPLVVVCVTNVIFYITTVFKIISCPHVGRVSTNKTHFTVYVKLFTITGITWALQIVDAFLTVSVLSYIVAVLNGLQGLFIFVSYVCNVRVFKMWKAVFLQSTSKHPQLTSKRSENTSL